MTDKMIGLMFTRNEGDVIEEVMSEYERQGFDAIYAIDSSDDDTLEKIQKFKSVRGAWKDSVFGMNKDTMKVGGVMGVMYEKSVKDYGYNNWIFVLPGDEIYHCDVRRILNQADTSTGWLINAIIAEFVLHESERMTIDNEDKTESIQKRRLWHYIRRQEWRAFYNAPGMAFDPTTPIQITPEGGFKPDMGGVKVALLVKNYPQRTPQQFLARIEDRVSRGWQPGFAGFLHTPHPPFVSSMTNISPVPGYVDILYSPIVRFDGKFRMYECRNGLWNDIPGSEEFRGSPFSNPIGLPGWNG